MQVQKKKRTHLHLLTWIKVIDINFRVKKISAIITNEPVIDLNDIELINFLREKYLCKYIDKKENRCITIIKKISFF